jgi:flagellar motility protein MotE (MotC chaperone)
MRRAALLFCLALAASAQAQVMKCVDRTGRVVGYGTDCPAGARAEATPIRSVPAAAGPAEKARSLAERDAEFRRRRSEQQERAEKSARESAETQERLRACEHARGYLKSLEAGQRIGRTDPATGERVFLTDSDYPAEMASARRAVQANCT